eukprot:scaffold1098_cov118-Isochrysis_galbana.AAC.3
MPAGQAAGAVLDIRAAGDLQAGGPSLYLCPTRPAVREGLFEASALQAKAHAARRPLPGGGAGVRRMGFGAPG